MKKKIIIVFALLILIALYSFILNELDKHKTEQTKIDSGVEYKVTEVSVEQSEVKAVEMSEDELAEELYFDSLETLAICVEAEAGNQDLYGKRLVVDVILNRVDSGTFPDDIESVIYQKNQFSTATNGAMDRVKEPSEETFEAVRLELANRTDPDILYFTAGGYNKYCSPAYKYGDHYFGY